MIRIQKIIADAGFCSRRKAENLIENGRVTCNGRKVKLGDKASPKDLIAIDGGRINIPKKKNYVYLMLNKPRGYVTTAADEFNRKCVMDLINPQKNTGRQFGHGEDKNINVRVFPVGRLDKVSEGLLLLTNDGNFANNIMHPSKEVTKTYRVTVRPDITDDQLVSLSEGVVIDGKKTLPATVNVLTKEKTDSGSRIVMLITIREGRNRQVRKMCEAVGLEVARLRRISIGPLKLGMLPPGEYRELTAEELRALRRACGSE
ncbi:MAG: rRNA pseudouridine synthase [Oscillospiraceae bacterium]|jgi:23S rRNA pseudouridine2605 synthase|nr:rRNA pseudouridine synthase [Oscillospiraceae bacterium]